MTDRVDGARGVSAVEPLTMWESAAPPLDATPIESGGAVLVLRLSPDEVTGLLRRGSLVDAIHLAIAAENDGEKRS